LERAEHRHHRTFVRRLVGVNLVVIALLGAATFQSLRVSREAFERQAQTVTENLAETLSGAIASDLKLIDNALRSARGDIEALGGPARADPRALERVLAAQKAMVPAIASLRITDARGVVRHGTGVAPDRPIDLGDRDYFRRVREARDDALVVSEPLRGRIDPQWGIALARRLSRADGTFEGMVYANIASDQFERLFSTITLGRRGALTLRSESLSLIARVTPGEPTPRAIGSAAVSPQLERALLHDPARGYFVSRTALDGIERTNAYRRTGPFPLLVITGLATDEFLAPWRRQTAQVVGLVALVVLVLAGGSYFVARSRQSQLSARLEVARLAREQAAMLDNELIGIVKTRDRRTIWKNKALDRMFGYGGDELLGQPSLLLYPDAASHEALGAAAYPALQQQGQYRTQLQMRRKDGELIWVDLNGAMIAPDVSMWMMVDITAMAQREAEVRRIAFHDALTGLPNRLLLSDRLEQALRAATRSSRSVVVAYFDLDGFKQINDRHGHAAGDRVLVEVARRMERAIRGNDTIARCGGDEFVVVLHALSGLDEALHVLQRLLADLCEPITLADGVHGIVGASIGVARFPLDADSASELLALADAAMYVAKREGSNRIHVAGTAGTTAPTRRRPAARASTT